MKVKTKKEAWDIVDELMPTDYELDANSVERAEYPIYHSTVKGVNAWVCDLNVRFEVNIPDFNGGIKTINVWFDEPADVADFKVREPEKETTPNEPVMTVGQFCAANRCDDEMNVLVMEALTGEIYMAGKLKDIKSSGPEYIAPYISVAPYTYVVDSWELDGYELWLYVHDESVCSCAATY